jgi:hypothetical protein
LILERIGLSCATSAVIASLRRHSSYSISLEAAFSWHLLYEVFLSGNSENWLSEWIKTRVPDNGMEQIFKMAIEVVYRILAMASKDEVVQNPFHHFLGV